MLSEFSFTGRPPLSGSPGQQKHCFAGQPLEHEVHTLAVYDLEYETK